MSGTRRFKHGDVQSHFRHLPDFHLAQRCLAGESEAITELQQRLNTAVIPFLVRSGAQPDEASEICATLLTDFVMPDGNRKARLASYEGLSSLDTWLHKVALNALLDRKRREELEHRLMPTVTPRESEREDESEPVQAKSPATHSRPEAPLLDLMVEAIEAAFASCAPEDFVLLQLSHCDRLHGFELAVMFRCHPAQITRRLAAAEKEIAACVIRHLRQTDPWLELGWDDFTELCRTATPACFGLD